MKYSIFALLIAAIIAILGFQFFSTTESISSVSSKNQLSKNVLPENLYAISENKLWGYIDSNGKIIIQPQFHSVGQFSEGLAPVRLNGAYGFIDKTGTFVLPPKYDVAHSFYNKKAKVYLDTIPYFIDKQGKILFEHSFKEIHGFNERDISIATTYQDKYGIINEQGTLVVDTIYSHLTEFSSGLTIVTKTANNPDDYDKKGVINTKGDFVVPFGKYIAISEFVNGFAKVEIDKGLNKDGYRDSDNGIIDTNGKLRFIFPNEKWSLDYGYENFSEDLAVVNINLINFDNTRAANSNEPTHCKGVINSNGKVLFYNKNWKTITPFHKGRAFAQDVKDNWFLINRKGDVLNQAPYYNILFDTYNPEPKYLFQENKAFVQTKKGWGAIDTMGSFVVQPLKMDFYYNNLYRRGSIIFFSNDISLENETYSFQYGFWNIEREILIKPQFHNVQFSDFSKKLVYAMQDGEVGYIDYQGKFIWKEKNQTAQEYLPLNINYMNRGYFYAASPKKEELTGAGGWGRSNRMFKKIQKPKKFDRNKLSISVRPHENEEQWGTHKGMKLYLANTSKKTFYFDAQDSRLYLNIQAQDKSGQWKDIEYLPSSWCGNSYHTLFLAPKNYWEFVMPVYEGGFSTKMRAKLRYKESHDQRETDVLVLYSNEFDGSINPAQFWQKTPYRPRGIMDPYNE